MSRKSTCLWQKGENDICRLLYLHCKVHLQSTRICCQNSEFPVSKSDKKRYKKDFDGLIIPGGESTVQGQLLKKLDLLSPLKDLIVKGLPVFGTWAGLLLLADRIDNDMRSYLQTMDIIATRNAYGRQLGSYYTESEFEGIGTIPMTFIRAPFIKKVYEGAYPLATVDGHIVTSRQGK